MWGLEKLCPRRYTVSDFGMWPPGGFGLQRLGWSEAAGEVRAGKVSIGGRYRSGPNRKHQPHSLAASLWRTRSSLMHNIRWGDFTAPRTPARPQSGHYQMVDKVRHLMLWLSFTRHCPSVRDPGLVVALAYHAGRRMVSRGFGLAGLVSHRAHLL